MDKLLTATQLSEDVLRHLFSRECLAIRVADYCDFDVGRKIASWFLNSGRVEKYDHEVRISPSETKYEYYGVDRVGFPFNKTLGSNGADHMETYLREALPSMRRVRGVCGPHLSPIDKLRLELDEVWSAGSHVANFIGNKMFCGIARIMGAEASHASEDVPHFDGLPASVYPFDGQFGANIYLGVPSQGGELHIWDIVGRDHPKGTPLPPPTVKVKPMFGDLIIFDAQRMHAITKWDQGSRISIQCFVGYKQGEALQLWN